MGGNASWVNDPGIKGLLHWSPFPVVGQSSSFVEYREGGATGEGQNAGISRFIYC